MINSKLMNIALLAKWIWKLSQNESDLWAELLKAKYFPNESFFESSARGSPFCNGIQVVKPAFALGGVKFQVLNGRSTRFWFDFWIDVQPLWMDFQGLYELFVDPDISVTDALRSNPPVVAFRRQLSPAESVDWLALCNRVVGIVPTEKDKVSWHLSASGKFSVKSLYAKISQGPGLDVARGLWKARIPLKVKIFL